MDLIERDAVIWITAETGALETQRRVKELPAVNRWISVEDALPEENEYVLALVKRAHKSRVILSVLINGAWKIGVNDCSDGFNAVGKITYWMPVPEPPESEVQNG